MKLKRSFSYNVPELQGVIYVDVFSTLLSVSFKRYGYDFPSLLDFRVKCKRSLSSSELYNISYSVVVDNL